MRSVFLEAARKAAAKPKRARKKKEEGVSSATMADQTPHPRGIRGYAAKAAKSERGGVSRHGGGKPSP